MNYSIDYNSTAGAILKHIMGAVVTLFVNGFGIYLSIKAGIGVSPWDVFNLGVSNTFGVLYGTASLIVSFTILIIDILMHEPIGIDMFINALVVGKSVDFFNWLDPIPDPANLFQSIVLVFCGLCVVGYTVYFYMHAALGCGPRDTLTVGITKRLNKLPIGLVNTVILVSVTVIGWLLGGKVGLGTLISALCQGPIMQFAFHTMHFEATEVRHQPVAETVRILFAHA